VFIMQGLPRSAWIAFAVWMTIGLAIYLTYGYRNSVLRDPAKRRDNVPPLDH